MRYSRAGRESAGVETVDIAALIGDLTFLLGPPESFRVIPAPGLPVVETQKAPIEQVLRNLFGNAIKHHDRPKGQVVVSAHDRGSFYEFSVADDGPGVPGHFRDRLFKMFQKLKPADEVEGNGIGLALVKRLVENHGGRVTLDPGDGRGATFRFTWPKRNHAGTGLFEEDRRADHPDR